MVKPATELAVAGSPLCTIAANPAGIAFDSFARRGHPIRLGHIGTVEVDPTMADLQTETIIKIPRKKRCFSIGRCTRRSS